MEKLIVDDREDVPLLENQELLVVELELRARILGEEHVVADRDFHRDTIAILVEAALPNRNDLAALRLLFGGVRKNDTALRDLVALNRLDDDAVAERGQMTVECHLFLPPRVKFALPAAAGHPVPNISTRVVRVLITRILLGSGLPRKCSYGLAPRQHPSYKPLMRTTSTPRVSSSCT